MRHPEIHSLRKPVDTSLLQVLNTLLRIKDDGRTAQTDHRSMSAKSSSSPAHQSYVPRVVLEPQVPPPISTLINMRSRYYLNIPSASAINDSNVATNCNLGRTFLRGIVLQMEELKSNKIDRDVDNAKGIRKSDLPNYCEYLRAKCL